MPQLAPLNWFWYYLAFWGLFFVILSTIHWDFKTPYVAEAPSTSVKNIWFWW